MPCIVRKLEFDAGHRVLGHESRCAHLHGHRYSVEIAVESLGLDTLGRVVDFGVVKQLVGRWIDDELDHNMLLHKDDPLLDDRHTDTLTVVGRPPFVMPDYAPNPTAENIAHVICNKAVELLNGRGIAVKMVRVFETPNCYAEHRP